MSGSASRIRLKQIHSVVPFSLLSSSQRIIVALIAAARIVVIIAALADHIHVHDV